MDDICACQYRNCKKREQCLRYTEKEPEIGSTVFIGKPHEGEHCQYFIDKNKGKTMSLFRLDYIQNFKPGTVDKMTSLRKKFIALEEEITKLDFSGDKNTQRVFIETLAHLEKSQMYAIKLLCLVNEEQS